MYWKSLGSKQSCSTRQTEPILRHKPLQTSLEERMAQYMEVIKLLPTQGGKSVF